MPKIVGIDFSTLDNYRKSVTVRMPGDKTVELPLIPVRASGIAHALLHKYDTTAVQFNAIHAKAKMRALDTSEMMAEAKADTADTVNIKDAEKDMDVIDKSMIAMRDLDDKLIELHKLVDSIGKEIRDFMAPYLKDTGVIEILENLEIDYTLKVFKLMLYGEQHLTETDTKEGEENPTTAPLQST